MATKPRQAIDAFNAGGTASMQPFKRGDEVWVFYRFQMNNTDELWIPVENPVCGSCSPRHGWSDGWQRARVQRDFDPSQFDDKRIRETGILCEYSHPFWYTRDGDRMHPNSDLFFEACHPMQVRRCDENGFPNPDPPEVSFLVIRWGGEEEVDPVISGSGGWGNAGSCVSNRYLITLFEEQVWPRLGPTYEVYSIFVRDARDLQKIHAPFVSTKLRGRNKVGLYFLWPVDFQDNPYAPGFIHCDASLNLMAQMEGCGVVSRFPHHSHLYKMLLSKDWMCHLCLMPDLKVPAATKVGRGLIGRSPPDAAAQGMRALNCIQQMRAASMGTNAPVSLDATCGVAKLGFSWEAMDVRKFRGQAELAEGLRALSEQKLAEINSVIVQEWVDFDIELRMFYVNLPLPYEDGAPVQIRPAHILYTRFTKVDGDGMMREFERMPRDECVHVCFNGDYAAMTVAEEECYALSSKLAMWITTECAEPPPFMRMDFLVKHTGQGTAEVHTGELTELGASFLGWDQGPDIVFGALIDSCFMSTSSHKRFALGEVDPEEEKRRHQMRVAALEGAGPMAEAPAAGEPC